MILTKDMIEKWPEAFHLPEFCFYCGERLRLPLVSCQGGGMKFFLHPICAQRLAADLVNDARKATLEG